MAIIKERPAPALRPVRKSSKIYLGCDPEFFIKNKDGGVVGAEKVLPKEGLNNPATDGGLNKIIIDGVQMEINPRAATCRAHLANDIKSCFAQIDTILKVKGNDLQLFNGITVEMKPEELAALDEQSRKFGCAPSNNKHTSSVSKIDVDPETYMFRSAGGHIHLGHPYGSSAEINRGIDWKLNPEYRALTEKEQQLKVVDLLDIVVGNTCVLLDRDPSNAERRKVYGRAGEFRTPPHGLEYRTLSNFWLKHIHLYSFVFEMARQCVYMVADPLWTDKHLFEWGYHSDQRDNLDFHAVLTSVVDVKDIERAINTNDYDLAYANFKKLEPYFVELIPVAFPKYQMEYMHHFFSKPLDHWFKSDMVTHWVKEMTEGHSFTFYQQFLSHVRWDLEKDKKKSPCVKRKSIRTTTSARKRTTTRTTTRRSVKK